MSEWSPVAFGQHGACGNPMVLSHTRVERVPYHPDQVASMAGRDIEAPEDYEATFEYWECPDGCTRRKREGRSNLDGDIG